MVTQIGRWQPALLSGAVQCILKLMTLSAHLTLHNTINPTSAAYHTLTCCSISKQYTVITSTSYGLGFTQQTHSLR